MVDSLKSIAGHFHSTKSNMNLLINHSFITDHWNYLLRLKYLLLLKIMLAEILSIIYSTVWISQFIRPMMRIDKYIDKSNPFSRLGVNLLLLFKVYRILSNDDILWNHFLKWQTVKKNLAEVCNLKATLLGTVCSKYKLRYRSFPQRVETLLAFLKEGRIFRLGRHRESASSLQR